MIFRMIVISIFGILLATSLKHYKPEYGVYISVCISVFILFNLLELVSGLRNQMAFMGSIFAENGTYFSVLFKMIGITYLCEFCGGICRDAGYQSIGSQVEIFGKITILLSGIPILMALLTAIQAFAI